MAPFEALYGHHCRTPLNCIEATEKAIFGLDLIDEAKATVCRIQDNLTAIHVHVLHLHPSPCHIMTRPTRPSPAR
jgi:hypothetical protein